MSDRDPGTLAAQVISRGYWEQPSRWWEVVTISRQYDMESNGFHIVSENIVNGTVRMRLFTSEVERFGELYALCGARVDIIRDEIAGALQIMNVAFPAAAATLMYRALTDQECATDPAIPFHQSTSYVGQPGACDHRPEQVCPCAARCTRQCICDHSGYGQHCACSPGRTSAHP